VVFDYQSKDWTREEFDGRSETEPESFKEFLPRCLEQRRIAAAEVG